MALHYRDIVHPEDEKALRQMQNTVGVQMLAEKIVNAQAENKMHHMLMADAIKLGPNQLPHIYECLTPIVQKFGIPEPDFFLVQNPILNAYTAGDKNPFIVVHSGLIEAVSKDELEAIIAHECGHILCRHCLYHTTLNVLQMMLSPQNFNAVGIPGLSLLTGPALIAAYYAANYWSRRSEYSADRAAALYSSPDTLKRALFRLHGGPLSITQDVNFEAYEQQAEELDQTTQESALGKLLDTILVKDRTHPFGTVRMGQISLGGNSAQYRMALEKMNSQIDVVMSTSCPNCKRNIESNWKFCNHCGQKL